MLEQLSMQKYQMVKIFCCSQSAGKANNIGILRDQTPNMINHDDRVRSAWRHAANTNVDIVITAANEMGSIAQKSIIGVQIVNVGSGFSIDDMTIDQAMTYVARKVTPWSNQAQIDKDTGNVSDTRSQNPPNWV